MPVILVERDWSKWLGEESVTDDELVALLKPCPDEALKIVTEIRKSSCVGGACGVRFGGHNRHRSFAASR
jgi:putative SOS response-associated peptidase YedK